MKNSRAMPRTIAEACGIKFRNLTKEVKLHTPASGSSELEWVVTNNNNGHILYRGTKKGADAVMDRYHSK